jgi:phosphoribosylamine--glycine ligase
MMGLKALVVGSGGREHAIGWALARSTVIDSVIAAPGNPGLASLGNTFAVAANDVEGIVKLAQSESVGLAVVGPEEPLELGIADKLRAAGIPTVGPSAQAAQLETSKIFARGFMTRHSIPIPPYTEVQDEYKARSMAERLGWQCAIKYDGLAAGKGVFVCSTMHDVDLALKNIYVDRIFKQTDASVLVEELLIGAELSILAVVSGGEYRLLPASRDYKRAHDNNQGPNTGGMGAYCPVPEVHGELMVQIEETIIKPTIKGLVEENLPYQGILYFGLILTKTGPQVLEYNVRLGDPETQVVLPMLASDFGDLMLACASGKSLPAVKVNPGAAVGVVLTSDGYPGNYKTGYPIKGMDAAEKLGATVFQAGTKLVDGEIVTAGGRVLAVTATGDDLSKARQLAYKAVERVNFHGVKYRRDIAKIL